VYFSGGPVLETGLKAAIGADIEDLTGGGEAAGRPSGRGGLKDPDVIQGRAQRAEKVTGLGMGIPPEYKDLFDLYMPPDLKTIRAIMRFDTADKLLVSGLCEGGEELAGKPAVVDVPVGKGHVVIFAINPMWRQQTFGSFCLLFNAAMNYRSLAAGRPTPAAEKSKKKKKREQSPPGDGPHFYLLRSILSQRYQRNLIFILRSLFRKGPSLQNQTRTLPFFLQTSLGALSGPLTFS